MLTESKASPNDGALVTTNQPGFDAMLTAGFREYLLFEPDSCMERLHVSTVPLPSSITNCSLAFSQACCESAGFKVTLRGFRKMHDNLMRRWCRDRTKYMGYASSAVIMNVRLMQGIRISLLCCNLYNIQGISACCELVLCMISLAWCRLCLVVCIGVAATLIPSITVHVPS